MKAYKNLIRSKYIELDDIKDVGFNNIFREYIGVSVDTFENKLGKIDSSIDQWAFKVEKTLSNTATKGWFKSKIPCAIPESLIENLSNTNQPIQNWQRSIPTSSFEGSVFDVFSAFPLQQGYEQDYLELIYEAEIKLDNRFIKTLKETYGSDWEFIYEKLMGFKRTFNVLLNLEKLLFAEENEKYINAEFRFQKFEYFDLVFTMKEWLNNFHVPFNNHPFYSSITSNKNEKTGFTCTSDLFQ